MTASSPDTIVEPKEQRHDFFFYGTLCVPAVLIRVLGHRCESFTFQDAVLPGYTRHSVKDESYPAIIGERQTREMIGNTAESDFTTRGTLVRGLSVIDVNALDTYEGSEYSRVRVSVQTLGQPSAIYNMTEELLKPTHRLEISSGKEEPAETWAYVWSDPLDRLVPEIWTFEQFVRAKASAWEDLPADWFTDVERTRALQQEPGVGSAVEAETTAHPTSNAVALEGRVAEGYPTFGREMLKYWAFEDGYVNFNHGSYGSPPLPVLQAMRALSEQCERNPDYFMRRAWLPLLSKVREEVSSIIGARKEEVVMVPNTTHGVNTILSNLDWEDGDVIVIYSTTYGAVSQTVKYLADRHPKLKIEFINLTFPTSHSSIVKSTEAVLSQYNQAINPDQGQAGHSAPVGKSAEERVKLVLVDAIVSMPGVIYPWEEVVGLCKKYGVLSLVDAAHSIGQVEVDVKRADCDFWVSNCHKWLMSHRGGAVLYVPLRNQPLIRSSFPTSAGYESARYPTEGIDRPWDFVKQFDWTGTQDWAPLFSVSHAIEFRRSVGGEERIIKYCHALAQEGGKRVAERWGTRVMETANNELTAAMVNVQLPHIPAPNDLADQLRQLKYLEDSMFAKNCFAAAYVHGGVWWVRLSAQIWLEMSDFDHIADVLEGICQEVKDGKYLDVAFKGNEAIRDPKDLATSDDL